MKTKIILTLLIVTISFILPSLLHAQSGVPDPGGDPDVPLDGGLSLLLAAGVGYVAKKGYEKRKKNKV